MSSIEVPKLCKTKTNYFRYLESDTEHDIRADQCIIAEEGFLSKLEGFQNIHPTDETSTSKLYPLVNIYYNHAEDVDAFERVNKLLTTRPSLLSPKSTTNEDLYKTDPYSERDAQIQYLSSRPVSFLILGKPGVGQEQLARKLADYWRCVYIEPETLIKEEIASGSRAGECIEFNLRCGRAVGIDIILRLIEKRVKSKSVQHRGFVITGLPLIPNELYEEDPVSSESAVFNVQEIFEDLFEFILDTQLPEIKHVSVKSSQLEVSVADEEEAVEEPLPKSADDEVKPQDKFLVDVGSALDPICTKPGINAECEEQLQFIFNLAEDPVLMVYIKCDNDDVMSKRDKYWFHIYTDTFIDLQEVEANTIIHSLFSKDLGADSYEAPEDFFDEMHYQDISRLQHLVKVPHNFPANVGGQLKMYHLYALNLIEEYILSHDPQYFIKLDGRTNTHRMFNILRLRLEVLPLQKPLLPERLNIPQVPKEGEELDEAAADATAMNFEDFFRKFRRTDVPNYMFKWTWSAWGTTCPVSMKEGLYRDGDQKWAVHFMNKIFFLSDEEAFGKFYRNPRPYLLPPYPKPSCRIFVFGPDCSGKTTIAKALAYLLNGTVIDIETMKTNYIQQKETEYKEKLKQAALIEGISILNKERENKRLYRDKLIHAWVDLIKTAFKNHTEKAADNIEEAKEEEFLERIELVTDITTGYDVSFSPRDPPVFLDIQTEEEFELYINDPQLLHKYLPYELSPKSGIEDPASVLDDFVINYSNMATEVSYEDAPTFSDNFSDDELIDVVTINIKTIEDRYLEQGNNRGGWIIDGMIRNLNILERLPPEYVADDVFVLSDHDNYLLFRYNYEGRDVFRHYRQFFMASGNVDAAWRSPGPDSTSSMRQGLVREILYDVVNNKYMFKDGSELGEYEEPVKTTSWAKSVDTYADHLRDYRDDLNNLLNFFSERNINPVEIDVTNKTLENLIETVIRNVQKRYAVKAVPFSDQDRYEEVQDFSGPNAVDNEFFEGPAEPRGANTFADNRRYGDTSWYCPVSLQEKFVLWRGKEDHAASFEDKTYLCSSQDDLYKFVSDPQRYVFGNRAPMKVPPVRVCVVGAKGVGKTAVAKKLANNLGVAVIDFEKVIKTCSGYQEDAVTSYINLTGALPEGLLLQFLNKLWFEEPIKYIGFVIDNFPRQPSDVSFMINNKAIPDLVLCLQITQLDLKTKLMDKAVSDHAKKIEMEKAIREEEHSKAYEAWKKNRSVRYEMLMENKRQARYKKKLVNKMIGNKFETHGSGDGSVASSIFSERSVRSAGNFSQVTYDSFADQKDQQLVEALLDKELPEPEFEEYKDDLEEFTINYEEKIEKELPAAFNCLGQMKQLFESILVAWGELNALLNIECIVYQAFVVTKSLQDRNRSVFERCYDISLDLAEQLLSSGYYFLSKFGRTCPVEYYRNTYPVQLYIPMKAKGRLFPLIHRQFIYFLAGEENNMEFRINPFKYISVQKFCFPLIPYRIAVIGPPKCGKTTLARRIQNEYFFKAISCGQAMRYVLRYLPFSKVATHLDSWLGRGNSSTHKMQMDCVEAACFDPHAVTQGVIFDGFPNNQAEVEVLRDFGLVPHLILYLKSSDDQVYERLESLGSFRNLPVFSRPFFDVRLTFWKDQFSKYFKWMDREYQNIRTVSTDFSFWHIFAESQKVFLAVFSEIKHYYRHAHDDWPLRIANMLITPLEYLERQSEYKSYCPCCLCDNVLRSSGEIPDRTTLVHFRKHFYWICDNHIEEFLKQPEKYLPPYNTHSLSKDLPKTQELTELPPSNQLYEDGICMVCYSNQKDKKLFTFGVFLFAVAYQGNIYLFDTKECMDEFMAQPGLYSNLIITYKDPKSMSSLKKDELPILGFLEQYIARDVVKALNDLVRVRPLVPGLSISVSACIHVGLFLKLNNPLEKFKRNCEIGEHLYNERREKLIVYLRKMKKYRNPYIYYEEPLPKFKDFVPQRNVREYARKLLLDILDTVHY